MTRGKCIALLTYGSRGDVEPFIALGAGLIKAGFTVRLAAPDLFAPLMEKTGIEFFPITGDPDELVKAFTDRAGLNWLRMVREMMRHVLPLARDAFNVLQNACQGASLIVHSFLMTDAGHTLAQLQGIPDLSAQFFPVFMATSAFPAAAMPDLPLGTAYRKATHAFSNAIFRHGARLLYRRLRASSDQLPALAPWPFSGAEAGKTPIVFAFSQHVLPRPEDWPPFAHVTGYWQMPLPGEWAPRAELEHFIQKDPAPIYFGIGSVRYSQMEEILRMVTASARACGQRLVLSVTPEALPPDLRGGDLICAQGVPHAWLFPRMRFIIHHGGAGTTGAAATAGVPSTAIPFTSDQAFWARRIHQLGLGPASPPARSLTRKKLDEILQDALNNPAYQERALKLAGKMRQEDGIAAALELIGKFIR